MNAKYIIIISIIIVIIIIIFYLLNNSASTCNERYNNYLTGMWTGDPDFLKQANLKDLQLFISPKEKNMRQGYVIMTDINGNFIMNEPIEFKDTNNQSKNWKALSANSQKNKDKFIIHYENASESDSKESDSKKSDKFPKNLKFGISMCDGTLTIHDTDSNKILAFLEKDFISSAVAIDTYNE